MLNVTLTNDQEAANDAFMDFLVNDEQYMVIHGSAGTGKSFLIKHLINTYDSRYAAYCLLMNVPVETFSICVTATTNKAVTVLQDFLASSPRKVDVKTIYQFLGLRIVNDYATGETRLEENKKENVDPNNPITKFPITKNLNLIFIDEASFINQELFDIIKYKFEGNSSVKVIFMGDQYQLAPVGQDFSVFTEVACKKCNLDEVKRNGGNILAAGVQFKNTVRDGTFKPLVFNPVDVINVDGNTFRLLIEEAFTSPVWTPNKCKILAWTNSRVQEYNKHIRNVLNRGKDFEHGETVITNNFISDRASSISVDSQVLITKIVPNQEAEGIKGAYVTINNTHYSFLPYNFDEVKVLLRALAKKKDWRKYFNVKDNWFDLRAVYASSIHKSQGSTYETVFIDLSDIGRNWQPNDVARLMYVAITRASKKVVCYGELPAYYRGE